MSERDEDVVEGPSYVDPPKGLHPIDPDPEPNHNDGWPESEFIDAKPLTAKEFKALEANVSDYLSILGETLESIDPYCGAIAANDMPEIAKRWSKVIGHYPNSWLARSMLAEGGGVLMSWGLALKASWPTTRAIYAHHFARYIVKDPVTGLYVDTRKEVHTIETELMEE